MKETHTKTEKRREPLTHKPINEQNEQKKGQNKQQNEL